MEAVPAECWQGNDGCGARLHPRWTQAEEILRHFLGDLSVEQIREYGERKDDMLRRLGNGTHPVEGVVELLASLKRAGLRAGLATSAGGARTRGTLSELGLGSYFDAIITGDEVATGKPNPLIYRLAAERMQEEPQYLIAVEDAVAGVKAATDAECAVWSRFRATC